MKEILDYLPTGIIIFQGREPFEIVYVNAGFQKMAQYEEEDVKKWQSHLWGLLSEDDKSLVEAALKEAEKKEHTDECEIRIRDQEGRYRWYMFRMSKAEGEMGEPLIAMSITDIHKRKRMEEELHIQMERYELLELLAGELPFDLDVENKEVLISRKYLDLCGEKDVPEHFAKQEEMANMIHEQDAGKFYSAMEKASEEEMDAAIELRIRVSGHSAAEEYRWYRLNYRSVMGMNGKIVHVIGRLMDIHEEKQKNYQLAERVKRDPLTGLLNKTATAEEIEGFLLEAPESCHAMLLIDVDNFKSINDTFGHLFGDTVLIDVAEKINSVFRKEDIVGRVGGDEFMVLMKNVKNSGVLAKAELLCSRLQRNYPGKQQEVRIGCSVGIAFFDQHGSSYEELFKRADDAMYRAKEEGKSRFKVADGEVLHKEGKRRANIDERGQMIRKMQDESFFSSIFFLLADAKDIDSSLQLLLERIGQRYELDLVTVLEDIGNGVEFLQTSFWKKGGRNPELLARSGRYEEWDPYMSKFNAQGLLYVDSSNRVKALHEQISTKSRERAQAMVNCCFTCQDGSRGMVIYGSQDHERVWSEFEKKTFLDVSKIISVFVSLRRNQKESENTIESLRNCDLLTGLYNENAFRRIAQEKVANPEDGMQYAVIYTDIRDFSYMNDNFGLETGNRILREFAEKISSGPNMISARFHSDLFISLVWDENREVIKEMMERIIQEFSEMEHKRFPERQMSLIAGIYYIENKDEDIDTAIENSNMTRKRIKRNTNRSGCGVYTSDLRSRRELENRINNDFGPALENHHFKVYIQPKFLLKGMKLSGGEALVRWIKPDGSMIFPDQFVPVLEQSDAIVKLDFFVLEEVLKYMQKWKEEGRPLYQVSVNFSRRHFEGNGIYQQICALTEKYQVDPKYIEVEITESMMVSGLDIVQTEMALLQEAGFSVAIDDFGTGYSSLSMLHIMPADIVKMDKSFLDNNDIVQEKDFIERVGALIRSVKNEIIFEGIETTEQVEFLVSCGFRYGQGYLYDRPMPIQVFEEKYIYSGENY